MQNNIKLIQKDYLNFVWRFYLKLKHKINNYLMLKLTVNFLNFYLIINNIMKLKFHNKNL